MSSRDPLVRHLASQKTLAEASTQRQVFKPFQQVVEVMQEDPGASQKTLAARAKDKVTQMDSSAHLQHCRSLTVQGQTARQFEDRAAELWAQTVLTSPDHVLALNAVTDTLPHNVNLSLWGKKPTAKCQLCSERQTLHHVLNHCSMALEGRHYNQRHDAVLALQYQFVSSHLQPGCQVTADLHGQCYCFPQDVATTDSRADIVIWNDQTIILIELTIPFEPGMDTAAERKRARYADLLARCSTTRQAHLTTIEVG